MELPLSIAKKLVQLLKPNEIMVSSALKHTIISKMIDEGVIQKKNISNTKSQVFISNKERFEAYVSNHFGITNLEKYIIELEKNELTRSTNISISSNSKATQVRTFKGFLVNSYLPIKAVLNQQEICIQPTTGSFMFISNFEQFTIDETVTVVGIENSENFSSIERQRYLFEDIKPLFVSRYPQSNDLVTWLQRIPNKYVHFGDLDFAGMAIYLNEFKKHVHEKASFFLPKNSEEMIQKFGNRDLYNKQKHISIETTETSILQLVELLHKFKKGLEQEIFIL